MSKSYYEVSRDELIKRLMSIRNQKYIELFRQSDEFELALSLAYFVLAEDLLIERNSKDNNISTRLKKRVDDDKLKNLITSDIIIHDKETDGNTPEWFLAALRNGIMHSGFDVDYEQKYIIVSNGANLNKLECSVSFDWFKNFILEDLLKNRYVDNYKYTVIVSPFYKAGSVDLFRTFDDVRKFVKNDLPAYDIEISFDETNGDTTKIGREEFTLFCEKRQSIFWRLQNSPDSLTEDEKNRVEKYKEKVVSELQDVKDSISEKEYYKRYYSKLFSYWFTEEFKAEFPNYNVSISNFDRNSPRRNMAVLSLNDDDIEEKIFPTNKKKKDFFFNTTGVFQRMDIASGISRIVNYDEVDYLFNMHYLFGMYNMHKDAVRDEYGLSKFMNIILRRKYVDTQKIQNEYMQAIHDGMIEEGIVHSYDEQITNRIIDRCKFYNDDIYVRCRELCNGNPNFDVKSILGILKNEFPDVYKDAEDRLKEFGAPSDQVLSVYSENDLYRLCNAKGVIDFNLNEMTIGLLYALGINTFVVNKETTFEHLTEDDYSFMSGLEIKGFSKAAYTICGEKRNTRSSNNKHIKIIDRNIPGISASIKPGMTAEKLKEKRELIAEYISGRQELVKSNQEINEFLNGRVDQEFGGVKMTSLTNIECAKTIRNCFAHSGRIFVEGRQPGGDFDLVLTDYDEKGNLSGVVKTNLSSLIEFFNNPVFKKAMDEKNSVVVKSKLKEE